jgi:hypothetical protein
MPTNKAADAQQLDAALLLQFMETTLAQLQLVSGDEDLVEEKAKFEELKAVLGGGHAPARTPAADAQGPIAMDEASLLAMLDK